jgi:flagellar protein FlaG
MLIQNTGNVAQAPQPAMPASDSMPNVVPTPSNAQAQSSAALELPQAAVKPAAQEQLSGEQAKNVVDNINKALKQTNKNLEFSMDEDTNKHVFKLKDADTGEVIRQYPTESMLEISRSIGEYQQGLLLKQDA